MKEVITAGRTSGNGQANPQGENMNIRKTTNYDQFKILQFNRKVRSAHVRVLTDSIKARNLEIPIVVNEKSQIVDGQHRFMALKELGLPIHFIVKEGLGLEEVQILNSNQRNWTNIDYLHSYADRGCIEYVKARDFLKKYGWHLSSLQTLRKKPSNAGAFRNGNFEIEDWDEAHECAEKICQMEQTISKEMTHQVVFIRAMVKLFKCERFDFQQFLRKLKLRSSSFEKKFDANDYLLQVDDVYNRGIHGEKYSFYQNLKEYKK